MKASTLIAPSLRMRSRKARSSGVTSGDASCARRCFDPYPAALGGKHEIQPEDDHRQREPLAHVQPGRACESDQLLVRLADEFDPEAIQAVEEQEGADQLARLVTSARLPEHEGQDG